MDIVLLVSFIRTASHLRSPVPRSFPARPVLSGWVPWSKDSFVATFFFFFLLWSTVGKGTLLLNFGSKYTLHFEWKLMTILFWAENSFPSPTKVTLLDSLYMEPKELSLVFASCFFVSTAWWKWLGSQELWEESPSLSLTPCKAWEIILHFQSFLFPPMK